jgi:hypothetical protein
MCCSDDRLLCLRDEHSFSIKRSVLTNCELLKIHPSERKVVFSFFGPFCIVLKLEQFLFFYLKWLYTYEKCAMCCSHCQVACRSIMTTFGIVPCKYVVVSANVFCCAASFILSVVGGLVLNTSILKRSPSKTHRSCLNLMSNRVKCNVCMVRRKPDVCHCIQLRAGLKEWA